MKGRRVSLFCHNLEINGANRFVYTLIKVLRAECDVVIFSYRDGRMRPLFEGLGSVVQVVGLSFDFDRLAEFDLVIVNSLMMSRVVLECASRQTPHVLVVHETWRPEKIEYYLNELWNIDGINVNDIMAALKCSQRVVFPASYLSRVYESLVSAERSSTIYCTIETGRIDAYRHKHSRSLVRKLLGIAENDVVFLQVGTVTRRKAQLSTLEAFIRMKSDNHLIFDMKLLFVGARNFRPGEREYIAVIEQKAQAAGIADKVSIIGVQEDIYHYFMASDVLVHPSVNEVLPLAILEAAYFGLPVIASNLDGMPEVIRHGCEGLLVNPYDTGSIALAMMQMASCPDFRHKCGQNARQRVSDQHGWDCFSEKYCKLFDDILHTVS